MSLTIVAVCKYVLKWKQIIKANKHTAKESHLQLGIGCSPSMRGYSPQL